MTPTKRYNLLCRRLSVRKLVAKVNQTRTAASTGFHDADALSELRRRGSVRLLRRLAKIWNKCRSLLEHVQTSVGRGEEMVNE